MASLSKRDLILRARKREKIKWLVFDCIAKQRMQFQLPPFNMNDPAIDTASQQVINEVLPQLQNIPMQAQVEALIPLVNTAIAQIAGGVVNGGDLADTDEQAYNRMMGGNQNAVMSMPYNAGADDGDPYAALILHQAREADIREAKLKIEDKKRRQQQNAFLLEQIELKKKLEQEAKVKQKKFDLIQKEKHHEWTRLENAKKNDKEVARRDEYKRILEYQQIRQQKVVAERDARKRQDQMFLNNIAQAQIASDARDLEIQVRWKEEARKTKEENDLRLGIKAQQAIREVQEDKERIRSLMEIQKIEDERRLANLESMKRHQEVLTQLGNKAAEQRAAFDASIEASIQQAILIDEEKQQKRDREKLDAKNRFLEEQRNWQLQEDTRKQNIKAQAKIAELNEVNRFKQKIIDAEADDLRKDEIKRQQARDMNVYLRKQMAERSERDRAAKVMMSPAELSMNAGVLQQFSPVKKPQYNSMQRAGQNIIF